MQGTNLSLYRQLAAEVPGVAFTASGGISSEAELLELQQMGTAAAILAKACIPARWTLPAACSWCRTEKEGAL